MYFYFTFIFFLVKRLITETPLYRFKRVPGLKKDQNIQRYQIKKQQQQNKISSQPSTPSLFPPKKGNKNKKKQTKQTNKKRKQVVEKREINVFEPRPKLDFVSL